MNTNDPRDLAHTTREHPGEAIEDARNWPGYALIGVAIVTLGPHTRRSRIRVCGLGLDRRNRLRGRTAGRHRTRSRRASAGEATGQCVAH